MLLVTPAKAVVYQWSTTIDEVKARESSAPPRAFLWIPDQSKHVRAVVIAIQNMQEEQLFNSPEFRKAMSELNFAIIWITPPMGTNNFRFDQGEDKVLENLLKKLADVSGYVEINTAPLVPVGHSASASWCWDVAAWNPDRTLAVVSLSGQWPYFAADFWGNRSVDGVPGMTTKGEFEIQGSLEQGWYAGLKKDFYTAHPSAAFTQVVEPGEGHFNASHEKVALINLFLRKAAQYRLPSDVNISEPVKLKPIDGSKMGWRYEVWHLNKGPELPAAPVAQFRGKFDKSFWAFDREMAQAIEKFQSSNRNKTNLLLAYRQKEGFTQPSTDHAMVHLKFEPLDDDLTIKLAGGFWDSVPATKDGKKAGWQDMLEEGLTTINQGDQIPHPKLEEDQFTIEPICGPVIQKSKDTFSIRFGRIGFDNPKRCSDIWFVLTYPGNTTFKRMVQQSQLRFPLKNTHGPAQTIDFPRIADVKAIDLIKPLQLQGKSSSGLKVFYYIREGPAEVDDNGLLTFTQIPPKSKLPLSVTVVAWQWGRSVKPEVQSAEPVIQTFMITQ